MQDRQENWLRLQRDIRVRLKIGKGGNMVDAKKIFGIMGLGAKKGDTVEFTFSGDDEEQAYTAISDFMSANL